MALPKIASGINKFFKKNRSWKIAIISGIFIIVAGGAALSAFYFKDKNTKVLSQENNNQQDIPENAEPEKANVTVSWLDEAQKVAAPFDMKKIAGILNDYNQTPESKSFTEYKTAQDLADDFTFIKIGKIMDGQYAGGDLYTITFAFPSPMASDVYKAIKTVDGNFVFLICSSAAYDAPILSKIFSFDDTLVFPDLEPPAEIAVPNSDYKLERNEFYIFGPKFFTDLKNPEKLFKYNETDYIYKADNCFVVKVKDGTIRYYTLSEEYPFVKKSNDQYARGGVLDITFIDGTKNAESYFDRDIGRCGSTFCYAYLADGLSETDLEVVATGPLGEKFYQIKGQENLAEGDKKAESLAALYKSYYPGWDEQLKKEKEKMPFSEFIKSHPILYWKGPFGDYIQFKQDKYLPMAECGKPVIYLYPEKAMDVNVRVAPTAGFTETVPEYGNGWFVRANTNGEIYNYADGKTYPYLFWEGRSTGYKMPEKGFVIEREEVRKFLQEKLAALGLNEKEAAEFIEFWAPRMEKHPYYFVSFVPQNDFDKMAPLTVFPKPDTMIRIFMDYKGLDKKISVEAPEIITPQRIGFTVVEWGGELRD